mgnify:CR=1 FL=1
MKTRNLPVTLAATLVVVLALGGHADADALRHPAASSSLTLSAADQSETLVDINSASEDALRALPGVGPARAEAIVASRPYKGKDDLVKRNVLPKNVYEGIKDRIIARQK